MKTDTLRVVGPDKNDLGTLTLRDGKIEASSPGCEVYLSRWRSSGISDEDTFAALLDGGWSNGYVHITGEPDGPDAEGPMEDDAKAKAARSRQLALLDTRALGHDVTPGHDELHHWWTKGPGLARWIGSPHQYTTLHAELVKATKGKLPPGEIDRMAASWVREVTGFWPGSDMHRVLEGGKPRGNRIGRG